MNIFIYGSGAQGRVALDILRVSEATAIVYFIEDNIEVIGSKINGIEVISFDNAFEIDSNPKIHIAFGNAFLRKKISEKVKENGGELLTIIHPNAFVASSARIGKGTIICSHSTINSNAIIGENVLINNHVLVEHDSEIQDYATVCPGVIVGGRCDIEKFAFIGSSATIFARLNIGRESIIGMGSVVMKNVEAGQLYYGVPALKIKAVDEVTRKNLL